MALKPTVNTDTLPNPDADPSIGVQSKTVEQLMAEYVDSESKDAVPVSGATMVSVGCKLPHGLTLSVYRLHTARAADGKTTESFVQWGKPVYLNGSRSSKVIGGYGLTLVDAEFFDLWEQQNGDDFAPVREGLIFKAADPRSAAAMAKERKSVLNGLEATDPTKMGPKLEPVDFMAS